MRIGTNKKPFYRVVVIDERSKRNGAYLDLLGTYNPLTEPKDIKIDKVKLDAWLKKGAQMSDGFLRMIGKAKQRPPRKPKKSHAAEAPRDKEKKAEEPKAEEKNEGST